MKRLASSLAALLIAWPGPCPAPPIPVCPDCAPPVFDNGPVNSAGQPLPEGEFTAVGDFNGVGTSDLLILDKATGLYRIGFPLPAGLGFHFNPQAQATGIAEVTGFAAGRFTADTLTSFVMSSPTLNRVQLATHGLGITPSLNGSELLPLPAAGPFAMAALDVATTGNTDRPELVLGTEAGTGTRLQKHLLRRNPASGIWSAPVTSGSNKRVLRAGAFAASVSSGELTAVGAVLEDTPIAQRFEVWTVDDTAGFTTTGALGGLPLGTRFVAGQFEAGAVDAFFFTQGSPYVRTSRISENTPGHFVPGAVQTRALALPVRALYPVLRAGALHVLTLYSNNTADLLGYTQAGGFVLVQSLGVLTPPPGSVAFSGAAVFPDGNFTLLWGDGSASGPSQAIQLFSFNPATDRYDLTLSQALPELQPMRANANLMVFDADVFSHTSARLLRTYRIDDWTGGVSVPGNRIDLTAETFLTPNQGLDGHYYTSIQGDSGPYAMGNQAGAVRGGEAVSVYVFDPLIGVHSDDVVAEPDGGSFDQAVKLTLTAASPGTTIYWRKSNSAAFSVFAANPGFVWLFADTSIEYYGITASGAITPRKTATFTFTKQPQDQDSDGDGVPDFVELAYGLDPDGPLHSNGSSADWDGDGYSDLDEILAGQGIGAMTGPSPLDPQRFPGQTWQAATNGGRLTVNLRVSGYDGNGEAHVAAPGAEVRVYNTAGTLLGKSATPTWPAYASVPVTVTNGDKILIVTSQTHFPIDRAGIPSNFGNHIADPEPADDPHGREVAGYVVVPAATDIDWSYTYNSTQSMTDAATAWVSARSGATGGTRPPVEATLNDLSTLKLLILEHVINMTGGPKGVSFSGSLTPFRSAEQAFGSPGLNADQIRLLETADYGWWQPSDIRAYRLTALVQQVETWMGNPWPELATMRTVAREIHQINARLNNSQPGEFALPIDVLRPWIAHGYMNWSYQELLQSVSYMELMMAAYSFYSHQNEIPRRPVLDLGGVPSAAAEFPVCAACTRLRTSGGTLYELLTYDGDDYVWPGTFGVGSATPLRVIAFDDLTPNHSAVEVIRTGISDFALTQAPDIDGNLLPDAWELYWFGSTGLNALGNTDGSAFSLLQEYLQCTDPTRSSDSPVGTPVNLAVHDLHLDLPPATPNQLLVRWNFPPDFANAFRFSVEATNDLLDFTELLLEPVEESPGNFSLTLPKSGTRGFYRVVTRLW